MNAAGLPPDIQPDAREDVVQNAIKLVAASADVLRDSALNDAKDVSSPCISVCRVDAASGWCDGCLRTLGEISAWSRLSGDAKLGLWRTIGERAVQRVEQAAPGLDDTP